MRSEPKQARSELTQANILAAVIEAGAEVGYASAKTRDIARRAHVSEGGMFRHFSSKAALFAHGFDVASRGLLAEHVPKVLDAITEGSAESLTAAVVVALDDPRTDLVIDVMASARTDLELARELAPLVTAFSADLRAVLAPIVADDPQLRTRLEHAVTTLVGRQLFWGAFGVSPTEDPLPRTLAEHVLASPA